MVRTLYLIRHGQTEANVLGVYPPDDTPLTAEGEAQATRAAAWFADKEFTAAYTSPLLRCTETARLLGVNAETVPALRDHECGAFTGKPFGAYQTHCAEAGLPLAGYVPPGGESYEAVRARVQKWLATLGKGSYLIVAHSDTIRWLIAEETGASPNTRIANAALWVIENGVVVQKNWTPWQS